MEEYKARWQELSDLEEQANLIAVLEQLGITTEDILSMSDAAFNAFKEDYLSILKDMYAGNDVMLGSLSAIAGVDMSSVVGYLEKTASYFHSISQSSGGLNEISDGLDGMAAPAQTAGEKLQGVTDALNQLTEDVSHYVLPAVDTQNFLSVFSEENGILSVLSGFVARFQAICSEIPDIWNSALAEAFGGSESADPLNNSGAVARYSELFEPMLEALEGCRESMDTKLQECNELWTTFQSDLASIIGVGGDSEEGSDKEKSDRGTAESVSKNGESEGSSESIVGTIQEGGRLIEEALNGENGWTSSFCAAKDNITQAAAELQANLHSIAAGIVACVESMAEETVNAAIEAIAAINMAERAAGYGGNHPSPSPYSGSGHSHSGSEAFNSAGKNNLLSGLGQSALPSDYERPLYRAGQEFETLFYENAQATSLNNDLLKKQYDESLRSVNSVSNSVTQNTQEINQEFYVSLPNVTDTTSAAALLRDLEALGTKKLQAF